jgi:hypothetical protein
MNTATVDTSLRLGQRLRSQSPAADSALPLCRLPLLLAALDIVFFSAVEVTGASDPPIKADVTPLLLRALVLCVVCIAAWLSLIAWREPSGKRAERLMGSSVALLTLTAAVHVGCSLLTSASPVAHFLATLTFSLHAALVCLPLSSDSTGSSFAPLGLCWLSCYLLVLDADDTWQRWPLAALLALHSSHAALAAWRSVR